MHARPAVLLLVPLLPALGLCFSFRHASPVARPASLAELLPTLVTIRVGDTESLAAREKRRGALAGCKVFDFVVCGDDA